MYLCWSRLHKMYAFVITTYWIIVTKYSCVKCQFYICFFFPLSLARLLSDLTTWAAETTYSLKSSDFTTGALVGCRVAYRFGFCIVFFSVGVWCLCLMFSVALDFQFPIYPSVFSNVYLYLTPWKKTFYYNIIHAFQYHGYSYSPCGN